MSVRRSRGQTMVLMMLTMLLLVLMVLITLGISSRAKEKAELQTLADAAAFSVATETARSYNVASLLNRTMVSHYAAMSGIQAEVAWVTSIQSVMGVGAELARMMEIPNPSKLSSCDWDIAKQGEPYWYDCPPYWRENDDTTCRSGPIRDVSYEMWHAGLSNYRAAPPHGGDNVNGNCNGGVCSAGRPWLQPEGMQELDEDTARQVKELHGAIIDLARIERATFNRLRDDVAQNKVTRRVVEGARGKKGWGLFASKAADVAWEELDDATDDPDSAKDGHKTSFSDAMAQAVMGTRVTQLSIEHDRDVMTKRLRTLYNQVRGFIAPKGWTFNIESEAPDTRALISPSFDNTGGSDQENLGFEPAMRVLYADVVFRVSVSWRLPCGPGAGTRKSWSKYARNTVGASYPYGGHSIHDEGGHTGPSGTTWNACHVGHAHYGEVLSEVHKLDNELLPWQAIGYIFPHKDGGKARGANGAWGMPKLPVLLTKDDPKKPDPWELDFKFRMRKTGASTRLDLKDGSKGELPKLSAYSAGIAYYHRRGHVAEPPNMLNPFWKATLVPGEIDEHAGQGDRTPNATTKSQMKAVLEDDDVALAAYKKLRPTLRTIEDK